MVQPKTPTAPARARVPAQRIAAVALGLLMIAVGTRWVVTRSPAGPAPSAKAERAKAPIVLARGEKRTPARARPDHSVDKGGPASSAIPWGRGEGELGRDRPSEGSPSGPMSFTVGADGTMYVLDQVNGRLTTTGPNGQRKSFPIASRTAQDLALAEDGSVAVLDRFKNQDVALYDASGTPLGSIALTGEGLENPGLVTGVFVDGSDVYVEKEHGPLLKVGHTDGTPAEPRSEIPGRPTRDGKAYLKAGIVDAVAGRAYVAVNARPSEEHLYTREIRLETEIHSIQLLDADALGRVYFGAQVQEEGNDVIVVVCMEELTGESAGSVVLPANTLPEESFRDLVVLDSGGVMLSLRSEDGVTYQRYDCE